MVTIKKGGIVGLTVVVIIWAFWLSNVAVVQGAEQVIKLKIGTEEADDCCSTRGWRVFKQYVEETSAGRIQADLYINSQLGGGEELFEALKLGTLQVSQGDATMTGFYPPSMVVSIPYLFANAEEVRRFFDSPFWRKLCEDHAKKTGVRVLAMEHAGFRSFSNNVRPIRTV
jgi:TRAP-type transport system periplasmic protein